MVAPVHSESVSNFRTVSIHPQIQRIKSVALVEFPRARTLSGVLDFLAMQTVILPSGSSGLALAFDQKRFQVVAPPEVPQVSQHYLVDSPPLADPIRGKRVLVIVSDLTRPTGTAAEISFLFGTGLHRSLNPADKVTKLDHRPAGGRK